MVAVTWVVVSRPPARAVTLVAFSGTAASTLGSAATASAVWRTKAGSFRFPRHGCGAR